MNNSSNMSWDISSMESPDGGLYPPPCTLCPGAGRRPLSLRSSTITASPNPNPTHGKSSPPKVPRSLSYLPPPQIARRVPARSKPSNTTPLVPSNSVDHKAQISPPSGCRQSPCETQRPLLTVSLSHPPHLCSRRGRGRQKDQTLANLHSHCLLYTSPSPRDS